MTNRELFHTKTFTRQVEAIREGYRQMHKGTPPGSVVGLFVILLLLYIFI